MIEFSDRMFVYRLEQNTIRDSDCTLTVYNKEYDEIRKMHVSMNKLKSFLLEDHTNNTLPEVTKKIKFEEKDIRKLKELKIIMGIEGNENLNTYTKKFFGRNSATYKEITPWNIAEFNEFLESKIKSI